MKKRKNYLYFFMITDMIYSLVKCSVIFWWFLIKTLVIFKALPLCRSLFFTTRGIIKGETSCIQTQFSKHFHEERELKKLNLAMVVGYIYFGTFVLLPFPATISIKIIVLVKVASFYIIAILTVLCIYGSLFFEKSDTNKNYWCFIIEANRFLVLHLFRHLLFFVFTMLVIYLSYKNFIFLVFFSPSILSVCANKCYESMPELRTL